MGTVHAVVVVALLLVTTGVASAEQAASHPSADEIKVDVTVMVDRSTKSDEPAPTLVLEKTGGFRFRPKVAFTLLGRELFSGQPFSRSGDVALMIEPYYHYWVNLNVIVSFRCVGVGVGADIAQNFGVAILTGTGWSWRPGPILAVYLAF